MLLLFFVFDIWFVERKGGFVRNLFDVLFGRKSWVGLRLTVSESEKPLAPGVLHPADAYPNNAFSDEMLVRLEEIYARDYSVRNDLGIMTKSFGKLGSNR